MTYFVHPAKAAVVRADQTSRLSVQFDGQNVTGDITAAQVAFWNAGRRSIRGGDILKPLVVRTANKARILEARLQKSSRDVVGLVLGSSAQSSGEVEIRWNILEQNDGGILQIVYSGGDELAIEAHAVLEGQSEIVRMEYRRPISTPGEVYLERQGWRGLIAPYSMFGMGLFAFAIFGWRVRRSWDSATSLQRNDWILSAQGLVMLGAGIWLLLFELPPGPPFGF